MNHSIRILLVDDHAVVRAGYRRLLEQIPDFAIAGEAASGEEAYRMLGEIEADVAIIDISMPGVSGIELVRRIRARKLPVRLLVFSVHQTAQVATRALEAGADGYLSKTSAADEMIAAVRTVAAGRRFFGADIARRIAGASLGSEAQPREPLSPREFEVLRQFSLGRSVDEVAETLHISPKTVANNLSAIKLKLGARTHAEMMRIVIEQGLFDEAEAGLGAAAAELAGTTSRGAED